MDLLKRELAPISAAAWEAIDVVAREALRNTLSARYLVGIDGPRGISFTSVNSGRLDVPGGQKPEGVRFGTYHVQPLTETRVSFSLPVWELDNIERGARDADLEAVAAAAREIGLFEERAVYQGFKAGGITGILEVTAGKEVAASLEEGALMAAVSEAQSRLRRAGVDPAANLVVSSDLWNFLSRPTSGGTLRHLVERQIGGSVLVSDIVNGGILAASRGGDMRLSIGQDFSIGYHSHTNTEINLFLMESFTFTIDAPEALVGIKVS